MVWDEPKRESNLAKHGLDFADARDRFVFEDSVIVPSHPGPDSRPRFVAIGLLDGRLVAAVISPLGSEALSLVGLRSRAAGNGGSMRMPRLDLPPITDEEEARIQAGIATDPDSPEITEAQAHRARPFAEAFPDLAANLRRSRGPQKAPTKQLVSLRLDPETVEAFKATGPGWQTRMNDALRAAARDLGTA